MLSSHLIPNLEAVDLPVIEDNTDPTSIPIVFSVTPEEFNAITKTGRSWNIESILDIIKKYSIDTYETIRTMHKNQVVKPVTPASYDKLITAFVKASVEKVKYTWAVGDKKTSDTYQIYLDSTLNRIIVSIYYGSRTIVSS
jgi:hypothetical protein